MDIHLYNTLSGKKELFVPIKDGHVSMYNCGPTVYDTVHIGNLRTFVLSDLLRRLFEFNGYSISQVMNITDVEDKIIARSKKESISLEKLTRTYEDLFINDIKALNILLPHKMPRATDHIKDIIDMITVLLEKKVAYTTKDGIYFSIGMVKDYGALAHINLKAETHERIAQDEYDKENPRDFALWKFYSEDDNDAVWDAPFGKGRPGWHIECSAMSINSLGETIDIHTGGTDLVFPHHTNEIAQSEAATGKQFVHYWIHGAFINVEDEKMAKSKGNFLKLNNLVNENISPLAYRYWLLNAHYRTQVNFTFETLNAAQTALMRFIEQFMELGYEVGKLNEEYIHKFTSYVNDDLDMPKALALSWELFKSKDVSASDKKATLLEFDRVLGLNLKEIKPVVKKEVPPEIELLAEARQEARKAKEWEKADALRIEIENRGFTVKDTESGFTIDEI